MIETARPAPRPASPRRRVLTLAAVAVLSGAIGLGLWWRFVASGRVTTSDAYVGGNTAQIVPLISAPVRAVLARDTDAVDAGAVLVVLDDAGARGALDQAEAELDRAIRRARGYDAARLTLEAQIAARAADVARAGAEIAQSRPASAAATANLASTRAALAQAHANLTAAEAALAANRALASGAAPSDTLEVASARARRDFARRVAERALLRAPFDGVIARRRVDVGQQVTAGTGLMTVVPVEHLYVDAHFKAAQLGAIRAGQRAKLISDTYGTGVTYHGTVVRRAPVRIRLDPAELRAHPLMMGTAMTASISIGR